jgi:hypothetical protein
MADTFLYQGKAEPPEQPTLRQPELLAPAPQPRPRFRRPLEACTVEPLLVAEIPVPFEWQRLTERPLPRERLRQTWPSLCAPILVPEIPVATAWLRDTEQPPQREVRSQRSEISEPLVVAAAADTTTLDWLVMRRLPAKPPRRAPGISVLQSDLDSFSVDVSWLAPLALPTRVPRIAPPPSSTAPFFFDVVADTTTLDWLAAPAVPGRRSPPSRAAIAEPIFVDQTAPVLVPQPGRTWLPGDRPTRWTEPLRGATWTPGERTDRWVGIR